MSPLNINVIGAGHWGPNVIRTLMDIPGVTVGCVADPDPDRLQLVEDHFPGVRTTVDTARALDDPAAGAVAIATPVETHFALVKAALERGKHVFVEKPLAATSSEAGEVARLASEAGLTLMVGHVFLFNPAIRKVGDLIERGDLGRILYVDAVRTNLGPVRRNVNAFWDLASHDLSILQFWLGRRPHEISASGSRALGTAMEDVVFSTLRYPDGVLAHVHASWVNPRKVRQITVVGDRRMAVWDDMDLSRAVSVFDRRIDLDYSEMIYSFEDFRARYHVGDVTILTVPTSSPLRNELQHFVRCIEEGLVCESGAGLALDVIHALEASDRSLAAQGAFVEVGSGV